MCKDQLEPSPPQIHVPVAISSRAWKQSIISNSNQQTENNVVAQKKMDCIIGNMNCKTKKCICNEHQFEVVTKKKIFTHNWQKIMRLFDLIVLVGAGVKSYINPSESSKWLGGECAVRRILEAVSAKMKPTSTTADKCDTTQIELLSSNLAESNLKLQQFVEMAS
jgi:hypothetical protein